VFSLILGSDKILLARKKAPIMRAIAKTEYIIDCRFIVNTFIISVIVNKISPH
jgi:hypothetical protein